MGGILDIFGDLKLNPITQERLKLANDEYEELKDKYEVLEREKAKVEQNLEEVSAERDRLKEENTRLKEENTRLRSEIKGNEKVSPEMKEILVIFFEAGGGPPSFDHVVSAMSIKHEGKAQYYFDELVELNFISCVGRYELAGAGSQRVLHYKLTPEGRAYVVEQGLVE